MAISAYISATDHDVKKCGIVVSCDKPFLACSPDGVIDNLNFLEVKCPFTAKDKPITPVIVLKELVQHFFVPILLFVTDNRLKDKPFMCKS